MVLFHEFFIHLCIIDHNVRDSLLQCRASIVLEEAGNLEGPEQGSGPMCVLQPPADSTAQHSCEAARHLRALALHSPLSCRHQAKGHPTISAGNTHASPELSLGLPFLTDPLDSWRDFKTRSSYLPIDILALLSKPPKQTNKNKQNHAERSD